MRAQVQVEQREFMAYLRECFDKLRTDYTYVDITAQYYTEVRHILIRDEIFPDLSGIPEFFPVKYDHRLFFSHGICYFATV